MNQLVLFVCSLLIALPIYSQNDSIDSLYVALESSKTPGNKALLHLEISKNLPTKKLDSIFYHIKKTQQIASANDLDSLELAATVEYAKGYYHLKSNSDSAKYYVKRGLELNSKINDDIALLSLNSVNAYLLEHDGKSSEAIAIHLENVEAADRIKDYKRKAYAYSGISGIYRVQGNGQKAVEYMEFAREAANLLDDSYLNTKLAMSLNLALAYDVNDQSEKGEKLLESILPIAKEYKPFSHAIIAHNLGRSYINSGKLEEAREQLTVAMSTKEWYTIPSRHIASLKEMTSLNMATNKPEEAVKYGQKTYALAKELGFQYHLEDATRNLADAYEMVGDYQKSVQYKNEYIDVIKNMFDEDKNSLMLDLDAKYQTSEKEKEIQSLVSQNKIRQRNTIIGFLMGLLLIVILCYTRIYNRKKNKLLLKQKEMAIAAQKDKNDLITLRLKNEQIHSKQQQQEKEIIALELKLKQKELTTNAMTLLQQKKHYEALIEALKEIRLSSEDKTASSKIAALINKTKASLSSYNWDEFQLVFEKVHTTFYRNLLDKFPHMTPNEKKISAFLKLGLSTKDISAITNQTTHSILIARSRLRKKLGLQKEESLTEFINTF